VVGAASVSIWDIVTRAENICEPVFLFDAADPRWDDMREQMDVDFECAQVHPGSDLAGLALTGLATFSDEKQGLTAALAQGNGLPGHDQATARALTDKGRQRAALTAAGVGIEHFIASTEAEVARAVAAIGAPCLVKPVNGWASRGIYQIGPGQPLPRDRHGYPVVVERLITGARHPRAGFLADYFSVETVFDAGRPVHLGINDRFPVAPVAREVGAIFPSSLPEPVKAMALAVTERALAALNITVGTCHTELKLTADGRIVVIEVNGRLGGYVDSLAALATGSWLMDRVLAGAVGQPVAPLDPATRVTAVYLAQAGPGRCRQEAPVPAGLLRDIEGIDRVEVHGQPGTIVDPADGTGSRYATIWLAAADLERLEKAHDQVREVLASSIPWSPA
jgi:cysteine synthase A